MNKLLDLFTIIYDFFIYNVPRFLLNLWRFKSDLYYFRGDDFSYNLAIFKRSLEHTLFCVENYYFEEESSKQQKIEKIKRTIFLLNRFITDEFTVEEEDALASNDFEEFTNIEDRLWDELWDIMKGQRNIKDGSDMRTWWD